MKWWACFTCGAKRTEDHIAPDAVHFEASKHKLEYENHDVRLGHGETSGSLSVENAARHLRGEIKGLE